MKKVLNFIAVSFLIVVYFACCIIMVPVFWKGQPAFHYWLEYRDTKGWTSPRTKQIVALIIILIILLFFWVWWIALIISAIGVVAFFYSRYKIRKTTK